MPRSAATSCKRFLRSSATGTPVRLVGGFQFGSERLGPHQSWSDMLSFHSCQILRERSVRRFSSWKPCSFATLLAPSPTMSTCPVCSITVFASKETFLMRRTAPTAPARPVGPCIMEQSSSTSPSSFGRPPKPTESSLGSSSCALRTNIAASRVSPPRRISSYAPSMLWIPVYLQTIIVLPLAALFADLLVCARAPGAVAIAAEVTAADSMNSRRENFIRELLDKCRKESYQKT